MPLETELFPAVIFARSLRHFGASTAHGAGADPMAKRRAPFDRSKRPLSAAKLDELALAYVARFATSRAKLTRYLSRKVRESEWIDERDAMAACAAIADRMERLNYLDDRQYAAMRAGAMTRRGLGVRRVKAQLYADGIAEQDSAASSAVSIAAPHPRRPAGRRRRVGGAGRGRGARLGRKPPR